MEKQNTRLVRRAGPLQKSVRDALTKDLIKIVENGEVQGITHKQLADNFSKVYYTNISSQLISKILNEAYETIPDIDIKVVKVNLQAAYAKLMRASSKGFAEAKNDDEKRKWRREHRATLKDYTNYLESFGTKEELLKLLEKKEEEEKKNGRED